MVSIAYRLAEFILWLLLLPVWIVALLLAGLFEGLRCLSTSPVRKDWKKETFETSKGRVELPILYYDGTLVGVFYLVDPAKAATLLPEGLEPFVLPVIGKAIAGIFMMEYRDTSIGQYHEMGLTIQAQQKGSRAWLLGYVWDMIAHIYHSRCMSALYSQKCTGLYVNTLPVSTESACAAGREIWGYPKYVTDFAADFTDKNKCTFRVGQEFQFSMKQGCCGLSWSGLPFLTYTIGKHGQIAGALVRTIVEMGHKSWWGGAGSVKVDMTGDGETARQMRVLGIDSASAALAFRTDTMQAHLPFGDVVEAGSALQEQLLR